MLCPTPLFTSPTALPALQLATIKEPISQGKHKMKPYGHV